jgi:RNA-directed DNA polymerase
VRCSPGASRATTSWRCSDRIIDSCPAAPGKGLPIGSLTSQHFANHYLDGADRFLLAIRWSARTSATWTTSSGGATTGESVRQVLAEILRAWLANERAAPALKDDVQINRSDRGVTYCGARVLRGSLRLTPRKQRRYRQGCRQLGGRLAGRADRRSLALQRGYARRCTPRATLRKRH